MNLKNIDQDKILQAVKKIQTRSTAEVVTLIVPQSDHYSGAHWRLGTTVFLLTSLCVTIFFPFLSLEKFFAVQLVLFLFCYLLGFCPILLRIFLSSQETDEEVEQRAIQDFFYHGLHETKHRNGILIMASLLERKVYILADRGINAKIAPETWKSIVDEMTLKIRAGEITDAFMDAVEKCGKILEEHFSGDDKT